MIGGSAASQQRLPWCRTVTTEMAQLAPRGCPLYSLVSIQSAYSLCSPTPSHVRLRCPLSSAASRLAGDRPVPHIVTELPGPKARAHVAFDEEWTSPSLPRAYPIVPV